MIILMIVNSFFFLYLKFLTENIFQSFFNYVFYIFMSLIYYSILHLIVLLNGSKFPNASIHVITCFMDILYFIVPVRILAMILFPKPSFPRPISNVRLSAGYAMCWEIYSMNNALDSVLFFYIFYFDLHYFI